MHIAERDRLWLAVRLFWGLGCENALFNPMTHGARVVLQESFQPGEEAPRQSAGEGGGGCGSRSDGKGSGWLY